MKLSFYRLLRTGSMTSSHQPQHAYVLLEEARLRCEYLLVNASGSRRRWLQQLHRELGTAGYCASAALGTGERLQLLERARRRSLINAPAADRIVALERLVVLCCRVVELEREFSAEADPDQVQLVRNHVRGARALFGSPEGGSGQRPGQDLRAPR